MDEGTPTPEEVRPAQRENIIVMNGGDSNSASPRSASPASNAAPSRPANPRSSTDPSPSAILQGWLKEKEKFDWPRPSTTAHQRNRSPYSRSHLRSRSSGAALLSAPLMTRAHSLPNPHTNNPSTPDHKSGSLSPASNQRSPARARSPGKSPADGEGYMPPPRSPSWSDPSSVFASSATLSTGIEAIQEDSELDLTPRPQSAHSMPGTGSLSPSLPLHSRSTATAALLRRRPASPAPTSYPTPPAQPNPAESSPSLTPQKYNEAFPHPLHHYASSSSFSSIPSTPTSMRSRSPSISSLETIEDAPEQESLALEVERLDRLRLEAERAEKAEAGESDSEGEGLHSSGRRKGSLDSQGRWRSMGAASNERKRWSVCGGERRGDLDLETIWED